MGGMASSMDEPMDVEVRCCIVMYSVPLDVWRFFRLFSVSDLSRITGIKVLIYCELSVCRMRTLC